ncbi:MAG: efflux RND transporter periplasmic adaptor subunit [Xanthomonadales bacterium]|nr:efflux RND transporter periplasmic adaptor subunit [Xanthomonadales bacterium]
MSRALMMAVAGLTLLAGCGGGPAPDSVASAEQAPLLIVPEDLLQAQTVALTEGPVISGSLQPELQAELRAEVAGVVLEVLKDNGDAVAKGDLLVRIDPTAIRGQLLSAQESERSAKVAMDQAQRQFVRMQQLSEKGLVAIEAVEAAEGKRNQSQSDLASARARVVDARQTLEKTEVRAPFAGIVGARNVSAGDTAQLGMQLLSVLDVSTMRFVGMIAADQVGRVEPGAAVHFRVNGYSGQTFEGQVQRLNPVANEATRQVQVLVSLPTDGAPGVAGLYAEGRIDSASRPAIMLPERAVVRDGDQAFVWQFADGRTLRTQVQLGERDARLGRVEITEGLHEGDWVLAHPLGALKDGGAAQLQRSGDDATAVAARGD